MKVVFAARRLNPGQYEAFRKAWEPPEGFPRDSPARTSSGT